MVEELDDNPGERHSRMVMADGLLLGGVDQFEKGDWAGLQMTIDNSGLFKSDDASAARDLLCAARESGFYSGNDALVPGYVCAAAEMYRSGPHVPPSALRLLCGLLMQNRYSIEVRAAVAEVLACAEEDYGDPSTVPPFESAEAAG